MGDSAVGSGEKEAVAPVEARGALRARALSWFGSGPLGARTPAAALALSAVACTAGLLLIELFRSEIYFVFSPTAYIAFHNVVESFSVMVSLSIFGVGWFTHVRSRDRHALFLSCAFLAIGLIDFMHMLAWNGMPDFVTPSSGNKAAQFWVAVRMLAALAFLASAAVARDARSPWLSRPVLLAVAVVVPAAVFVVVTFGEGHVPPAFVPGVGLTPLKRYAEYAIVALLLAAIVAYQRRYARAREPLVAWLSAAFAVSAFSELLFTAYRSVTDTINALGHVYKLGATWLVYRGIFIAAVRLPYDALFESRESLARESEERAKVEERLRQSHKLEAVGRLAGGIAHDFNNILTAILGGADSLLEALSKDDPRRRDAQEVKDSARRAAALTRQLLAFSRRQVVEPRAVDLNELVTGMDRMLHRLVGEEIEFRTLAAPGLGTVLADPGQLEQVVVNLVLNARDAMPAGGELTIETTRIELADPEGAGWPGAAPGQHVRLEVRDTGVGMSDQVKAHLFEPFFTTKGPEKGTGLGLSTVYGIVKQAGGGVRVRSVEGKGTCMEVILPCGPEPARADVREGEGERPGGTETVIFAEDEPVVRRHATRILRKAGYEVLEAADGEEALRVAESPSGRRARLLVTDVRMPRLGGEELADRLRRDRPELRVLFVTGYADHEQDLRRRVQDGDALLLKPYTAAELAQRVREAIGPAVSMPDA